MIPATLTRGAAHTLIGEYETDLDSLLDLQQHWIGHRDFLENEDRAYAAQEVMTLLCEYADACADDADADATRSNGPKDSDDTGLTAP